MLLKIRQLAGDSRAWARAITFLSILFAPILVLAATGYVPLESSVTGGQNVSNFGDYLKRVYEIGITITITLAVLYLVIGGFGYITSSASLTKKEDSKNMINNALFGLVLALLSYVILNTISPQFTQFNLNIGEVGKGFNKIQTTGTESGVTGSGCLNCVTLTGVPTKPDICDGGVCQLNKDFAGKLSGFNAEQKDQRVTEGYPPTATHKDPCHYNGTCVDTNFTSNPTPEKIKSYIETAQKYGLRAVYEVGDEKTAEALRKSTGLPSDKIISAKITAPHFSLYNI